MFEHYVYVYLNPLKPGNFRYNKFTFDFEPFYIGMGKKDRIDRHIIYAKSNLKYKKRKSFKDNIILKILREGCEPIRYKLYENLSLDSAKRLEKYFINLIGRKDLGYGSLSNHTDGGDGKEFTNEMRKIIGIKVSNAWKNGKYNNVNFSKVGENNPFYVKFHSNKTKDKIRSTIGEKRKGELNSNFGKKWSLEQKEAASIRQKENHSHLTGDNNPSKRPEARKKSSESKMGSKNPRACKWELISPENMTYFIDGGIRRNLKFYGLDYQQFQFKNCRVVDNYRINKKGWKLKKVE